MKTHRPPLASFLAFELRRVLRSPGVLVWTLAFPAVFYLVNFANKTNNPGAERWAGTTWAVYFMVSMCAWAAIAAASTAGGARLAAERASGWTRHLRLTPLPSWARGPAAGIAENFATWPLVALTDRLHPAREELPATFAPAGSHSRISPVASPVASRRPSAVSSIWSIREPV